MGNQNSHIRRNISGVYRETLLDLYDSLSLLGISGISDRKLDREAKFDHMYVEKRICSEDLQFVTIMLPNIGKYIDGRLSGKSVGFPLGTSNAFLRLPLLAFDSILKETEGERKEPTTAQVKFIRTFRTLLYLTYKLELPPTQKTIDRKIDEFVQCEKVVSQFVLPADNRYLEGARHVLTYILRGFDPTLNIRPKHGPGAVATGEKGDAKWVFTHLYHSLHQLYPYYDYVYGTRSEGRAYHLASRVERYRNMERYPYPTARLCVVPKDSRGPRIISCEPLELQYMQQAVAPKLMSTLERNTRFTSRIIKGRTVLRSHINFIDQSVNAELALSSSEDGQFATLDLSEASDRVSQRLFEAVWPEKDIPYINALRSHATLLPNGETLRLTKFAPMGSALCFPVESALFYALSVAAVQEAAHVDLQTACGEVFVYGDDIIVRSAYADIVGEVLEMHGLLVNAQKSFSRGPFRESCGTDGWHGHFITPLRIRKLPGQGPSSGTAHAAWLDYSSQFFEAGMPRTAMYCKQLVEEQIGTKIPFTPVRTGYLSVVDPTRVTPLNEYVGVRWSAEMSSFTARVWTLKTKSIQTSLDDYERLHRNLLSDYGYLDPEKVVVKDATQISRRRRIIPFYDFCGLEVTP